jgi:hypothetical protein
MNRTCPKAKMTAFVVRLSSLAVLLAMRSAPAVASTATAMAMAMATMICPDEIEVAIDPIFGDAVTPASARGNPNAFTVVLSGIDDVFMAGNGAAEVTVDVDGLFDSSPTPLPIEARATFIPGASWCDDQPVHVQCSAGRHDRQA